MHETFEAVFMLLHTLQFTNMIFFLLKPVVGSLKMCNFQQHHQRSHAESFLVFSGAKFMTTITELQCRTDIPTTE
jgi:hypothetical protein